jgi:general secretion pathway protein F
MPIYKYQGLSSVGKNVKATIKAESISQAKQKIKSSGVMLTKIEESKDGKSGSGLNFTIGQKKISTHDLTMATRQLSTLVKAKIQIVESLEALTDQSDNPRLKVILAEVKQKVNEGSSLSKALSDYPKVFDSVYVNMVDAGESSGTLDVVLQRLAEFQEARLKLGNKIKSAMIYPVIMIVIGALMMGIIFAFVIPKISKIFINMKKELPPQTKVAIWISEVVQSYWWLIILCIFGGLYLFKRVTSKGSGQKTWHSIMLKLPLAGEIITMINVSRFCSTLATLLNSGVPILISLKIVRNLVSNVHMEKAVQNAQLSISEGGTLASPLKDSGLFPSMVTHMISLGEKSGELEPMLEIISDNYSDQVENKLGGLASTLEPIMIIAMGLSVAFIVFSVVAPLMELNQMR